MLLAMFRHVQCTGTNSLYNVYTTLLTHITVNAHHICTLHTVSRNEKYIFMYMHEQQVFCFVFLIYHTKYELARLNTK